MKKNILVLTYWSFSDALIQTYTLPYLRIIRDILPEGSNIFLVTLEKENASAQPKSIEKGIQQLSFSLIPFGMQAALSWRKNISFLKSFIRSQQIDTIHAWCTPAGAIGYLLSKKTKVPLIIDSYEPHAESMVENGTWKKSGIAYKFLFRLEKKQTHHARFLIGTVPGMKEYAKLKYDYSGNNFFSKPACIDLNQFNLSHRKNPALLERLNLNGKIICVYAGKFGGIYFTNELFLFFERASRIWGDQFRVLLLTATSREEIDHMCKQAALDPQIVISAFVPHNEIQDYLGLADFAFSAIKPVPSKKYCTPIKNGEFWAMGLPVIIPENISEDSDIIASSATGIVLKGKWEFTNEDLFESKKTGKIISKKYMFNTDELDEAINNMDVMIRQNVGGKLSERIHQLAVKYRNFKIAEDVYRKIYGS
jgi:hypothetical protein